MNYMKKVQLKGAKDADAVSLYEVVQERLKISFDGLNKEEQEIFLDIACFFIGEEKSLAIAVWDGSGWSGAYGWEVLENKCLVEVDERNHIKMHDHIRDLGKKIAKERSPYRVWSTPQIMDIQRQAREGVLIRGIKAVTDDFYEESSSHHCTPFEECMALVRGCSANFKGLTPSILVVKGDYFTEEFANLFPALLWLRWIDFPEVALPSWLMLNNLRVLQLPYAKHLEELWTDAADPPFELRELNLENTQNLLRFPRKINCLKHLKKISLKCSARLHRSPFGSKYTPMDSLPEEFCLLESLEHLQLDGCVRLTSLPSNFGNLTNLRHLDLSSCWTLRTLPDSLKQLINLQYVNFSGCKKLTLTSERNYILENMTKLETLNLFACENLQKLPLHVTNQLSLRYLNVKGTKLRELPSKFGELSKLENLRIESQFLTMLPPSIVNLSSLTSLDIYNCRELEILPESIGNLASLTKFSISHCIKLKYLPESIGCLSSLTYLHINGCLEFETLPESIKNLASLTKLSIYGCKKLKCLPESIGSLEKLRALTCCNVPDIQNLDHMERLQRLELSAACNISAFEPCLQTIKKWPSECMICARKERNVESVLNSSVFPGLTLVDSCVEEIVSKYGDTLLSLKCRQKRSSNAAAMVCFEINSRFAYTDVTFRNKKFATSMNVGEGKWIFLGVFKQPSLLTEDYKLSKRGYCSELGRGMLVMGDQERVVETFKKLLLFFGV
ncbi:hypothetical protein SUGI_0673830 [Cryptomeria japonica]|nr:hypothetical protein SUGI_0673830 [Cryptomeria japonica]